MIVLSNEQTSLRFPHAHNATCLFLTNLADNFIQLLTVFVLSAIRCYYFGCVYCVCLLRLFVKTMECLFCGQTLQEKDKLVTQNPRLKGLSTIIRAAEKRKDTCAQKILHQKEDILGGKVKVKFHKTCRQTFISTQNIGYVSQSIETENASSSRTRYTKDGFNIRQMCLICNRCGKKGQQRLTSVQIGKLIVFFNIVKI